MDRDGCTEGRDNNEAERIKSNHTLFASAAIVTDTIIYKVASREKLGRNDNN